MNPRLSLLLLVVAVAGILVLTPPTVAEDQLDQDDGLDVEDELDLGLVDEEDEEGGDAPEEEVAKAAPPAPKVGGLVGGAHVSWPWPACIHSDPLLWPLGNL